MVILAHAAAILLAAPPSTAPNLYGTWLGTGGEVLQVRGTSAVIVLDDRVVVGRLGDAGPEGNRLASVSATPRHVAVDKTTSARIRRLDDGVEVCVNGTRRCAVLHAAPHPAPGPDDCLARCVEKTQMRAVSMDQIKADCARSCERARTP